MQDKFEGILRVLMLQRNADMPRHIIMVTFFFAFLSCHKHGRKPDAKVVRNSNSIDLLETDLDTLPNGKRLLDNMDSGMVYYYKMVVGSDTLKGGYILCHGIDENEIYLYLRHGDTLRLLNQVPAYTSPWGLGLLEKDYDNFFITAIDNGNGSHSTYQVFDKHTGTNVLGDKVEAWDYITVQDTLFLLYDNHYRRQADSIFLFNVISGRREGFRLPKQHPDEIIYFDIGKLSKRALTVNRKEYFSVEGKELNYNR